MRLVSAFFIGLLSLTALSGCGEKDEEKASQNRPAIPGY
jgi:outer membrane lipoprotein-sorting protein